MNLIELRDSLIEEAATILGADFSVEVTESQKIPHSSDSKITFPNLDEKRQSCKLVDTCVLYIDMRRSTELSLRLKPHTVVRLYSSFVRAMTRCARYHNGHVRGIIGDRVMVLFDEEDAFENAVECAVTMNSVAKYVINKHFKNDEVTFGIGIDAGRMLVTKTGIRKNGVEINNYKNLVWLGKPANIASKLTDVASKPRAPEPGNELIVVYERSSPFGGKSEWRAERQSAWRFVNDLIDCGYPTYQIKHKDPEYRAVHTDSTVANMRPDAPSILMTSIVWEEYKKAKPSDDMVVKGWVSEIPVQIPGFGGKVYGGNVVRTAFTL